MTKQLRLALKRLVQWLGSSAAERRTAKARARFWAELREGECEADARSRP
jgi:hypothetical protein